MLKDLIVVANNLGFSCTNTIETCTPWDELHKQDIMLDNGQVLMNVKVFKNGNMHLKLNQKFIKALNIEAGRIKGWVKDKSDVKEEMGGNDEEINQYFRANHAINISSVKKLLLSN